MAGLRPLSLAKRSAMLFFVLSFASLLIAFSASAYLVLWPVARASVNDLSALIAMSAQTWHEMPLPRRRAFVEKLGREHQLELSEIRRSGCGQPSYLPYLVLLGEALGKRFGAPAPVCVEAGGGYYVDVPSDGTMLRFRFSRDRVGTYPVLTLALALLIALGVSAAVAFLAAQVLTRPLRRFGEAAAGLRRGEMPASVPEAGPPEIAELAKNFNLMAQEVRDLTHNRATLLAGVSHDLRTPIARMRMALELFRERRDPALLDKIEVYLEEMNGLIACFLEYTQRALLPPSQEEIDLPALLTYLADDSRLAGHPVVWQPAGRCLWRGDAVALRRLIRNLLENAVRFAADTPPELQLDCTGRAYVVRVLDRGPGIPEAMLEKVFHPFVRLDASRNADKGGVGLGLALVRELSRANGWGVRLLRRAGGGTEAVVELPLGG